MKVYLDAMLDGEAAAEREHIVIETKHSHYTITETPQGLEILKAGKQATSMLNLMPRSGNVVVIA